MSVCSVCVLYVYISRRPHLSLMIHVQVRIDGYFDRIRNIIAKGKLSGQIRCMLQDVLELRENKWVRRRHQKTADEVGRGGAIQ